MIPSLHDRPDDDRVVEGCRTSVGFRIIAQLHVELTMGRDMTTQIPDILFFSRGMGRGHAIPDLAIVRELRNALPAVQVTFVSYGAGAALIRQAGEEVVDLGVPETVQLFDLLVRAGVLLKQRPPSLVVAHEDSVILAAAKVFGCQTVFLTHWFTHPQSALMQALIHADEILFLEREGLFLEPEYVRGRVTYVGAVTRHFDYTRQDRDLARADLGIRRDSCVILVLPGREWATHTPEFVEVVVKGFRCLDVHDKQLVWIADKNSVITTRLATEPLCTVVDIDPRVDRWMVASDAVITKGTYTTGKELEALGIPSIAISDGVNAIDDFFARSSDLIRFLWLKEARYEDVASHLEIMVHNKSNASPIPHSDVSRAAVAAGRLAEILLEQQRKVR